MSVEQFDAIFEKLYAYEFSYQQSRHRLWRKERVEKMVEKNSATLREYLCITLLYLRQYNIQEVLATSFGISQAQVSKIVQRISHNLEQVLPVPSKAVADLGTRLRTIDASVRAGHAATLIIDASEQRIERSQDKQKQRQSYSGKKSATAASSS